LVPLRGCHLAQRAVAVHSGVVDEDVHRAEVAGGQGQDLVAFLRPGEIALDDARPSAALLDLARERRRLLLAAAVMDGERGAFESQRPRNRASDPPRGPGDDGNFSSETRAFDRLFTCRARLRALAHAKLRRTAAWAPSPRSATVSVRWIQLRDGSAMILATSEQRTRPARVGPPERRTYIERDGSGRREASDPSRRRWQKSVCSSRPFAQSDAPTNLEHLEMACSSMFAFCVMKLGFSEDATYNRLGVAHAGRKFPAVLDALRSGEVHLSGLRVL